MFKWIDLYPCESHPSGFTGIQASCYIQKNPRGISPNRDWRPPSEIELCSKPVLLHRVLVGWLGVFKWIMMIPDILVSTIPYSHHPTGVFEHCSYWCRIHVLTIAYMICIYVIWILYIYTYSNICIYTYIWFIKNTLYIW